jgi:hypothetical protein
MESDGRDGKRRERWEETGGVRRTEKLDTQMERSQIGFENPSQMTL